MRSPLFVVAIVAVCCAACGTEEKTCGSGEPYYPLEEGAWWVDRVDEYTFEPVCKVVSVMEDETSIPMRPDVEAFPVMSERSDMWGKRWQEVLPDGSVRRHVDEWYNNADNSLNNIVFYCAYQTRVDDGAHACAGATWTETWLEREITVDGAANPDDCNDRTLFQVDSGSCEIIGTPPAGCTAGAIITKSRTWEVVAVDEQKAIGLGTFPTLHLLTNDEYDGAVNWWWQRGVGKILEDENTGKDVEELVDYCLPAEGCTRPIPDATTLDPDNNCAPF